MSSEKRKIAFIDGKPYEIGSNHTSILKFVKSYLGEKKVPTLCDDPNLAPYGACLLYTSDAADEEDSVDLGGRRIIKKRWSNKSSCFLSYTGCRKLSYFY